MKTRKINRLKTGLEEKLEAQKMFPAYCKNYKTLRLADKMYYTIQRVERETRGKTANV